MSSNPYAPNPNLKIWLGHELVPVSEAKVSVFDHGLLYGDGVFEGIRIYNGKIFEEQAHIKRLYHSARAIRLDIPLTPDQISHAMHESMKANGIEGDGYIRLLVTRGVGLLGLSIGHTANPMVVVIADRIQLYPPEVYARGLHCIFSSLARNHPNTTSPRVKSLNYLNNIMAKAEAKDAGADEAILLTIDGHISECTGDNIFIVRDGAVFTPPTSEGILEGITRGLVIELMRKRNIRVEEKSLIRHDIYVADEIFATGTAAEVIPITEVERRPVADGNPGPITTQLIEDFVAYRDSV
ncbi:MAG: branched-chain-amino-acid transaminase [Planctomycetes bacterium]|nr:branched-chain-amino-acid transaminase [Planctomycetota bacterium]